MFLASNICRVSSGTVMARYCALPRAVKGATPVMKKCRRGKGSATQIVRSTKGTLQERRILTHVNGTGEAQARCDARYDDGDEVVKVTVCWCLHVESPEADAIEGLIINAEGLVGVLDELMHGESGIVGLECLTYQHYSERENFHQIRTSITVSETLGLGTTEYMHIILSGYSSNLRNQKGACPAPVPR
jgi:hypothetical protein